MCLLLILTRSAISGCPKLNNDGPVVSKHSSLQALDWRRWIAPEIVAATAQDPPAQQLPWTHAADVYAFGLVMLELATFLPPFSEMNDQKVRVQIVPPFSDMIDQI